MGKRVDRRRKKQNKIKKYIRYIIYIISLAVIGYVVYTFYQEAKLETEESQYELIQIYAQREEQNKKEQEKIEQERIEKEKQEAQRQKRLEGVNVDLKYKGYEVDASLEIPKLNLKTNVLKDYSKAGMEICVSKYWGPKPNEIGNYCIAGHNYINDKMFYRLSSLEKGNKIYLSDNQNGKYGYTIYDIYKVKPENIEPISQDTKEKREITLITCSNYSTKRLIVKAVEENEFE